MSLTRNSQQDFEISSKRDSILLKIREIKSLKNYEIAEILGVEQSTIGRGNSLQLLNALKLLLENLQLRAELERIEAAKMAFYTPSPFIVNDAAKINSDKVQQAVERAVSYKEDAIKQRRRKK